MSFRGWSEALLRRVAPVYLGLVVAFAVIVSAAALCDHLTVLFVDDWRVLDRYQSLPFLEYLFMPQNGHYLPATLALFALDHELLGGRMHLLVAASLVCAGLAAALLYQAFRSHGALAELVGWIVLGFAWFSLFWAAGSHDLLWGLNQGSLQAVALLLLALSCLGRADPARFAASRRLLGLAVLAALLASLSQSVGVASWAALVAAAAVRRFPWRVVAALAAAGGMVVACVAASLPPHPKISLADSLAFAVSEPLSLAQLALTFVGSAPARALVCLGLGAAMPDSPSRAGWAAHTHDLQRFGLVFGAAGLVLFAATARARWRRPAPRSVLDAVIIGLMAFGVGGALLVAFARAAIFGPAAVVQTRFLTWSTLFWIGAACAIVPRGPARAPRTRAMLAALLLPVVCAGMIPALRDARAFHATRVSQASKLTLALQLGLRHDELARNVSLHEAELVYRVASRLEAEGRPPFDGPRSGLRGTPLRERFAEAGGCAGATLGMRSLSAGEPPAATVSGWTAHRAGHSRPLFVVLVDGAGVIRGLADFASAPAAVGEVGDRLRWAGFVADYDASLPYSAFAVLADGRSACRLELTTPRT